MIAPETLREQVRSTAAWALADDSDATRALLGADPFLMQLAAHYITLDTFVPTDVDSQIRFHQWQTLSDLTPALEAVERAALWPVSAVSNRTVEWLAGHCGEWSSIRAGALGRAHVLKDAHWIGALRDRIRAQVDREMALLNELKETPGRELDTIRAVALIAHNLGDIARVAENWPQPNEDSEWLIGLPAAYPVLGDMNRELTANDNHRFLPLRQAKCLREKRALILPTGPFFDSFGQAVAKHASDPGEVLARLLEGHSEAPGQQGYVRAIAGLHQTYKGGIDRLADEVPARMRKHLKGPLRQQLDFDQRRFEERVRSRYVQKYRYRL